MRKVLALCMPLLILLFAAFSPCMPHSDYEAMLFTRSTLQGYLRKTSMFIDGDQRTLDALTADRDALMNEKKALRSEHRELSDEISDLSNRISELNAEIEGLNRQLATLQAAAVSFEGELNALPAGCFACRLRRWIRMI